MGPLDNQMLPGEEEVDPMAGINFPIDDEVSEGASQEEQGPDRTEEYKIELQAMLDDIKEQINIHNSKNIESENEIDRVKGMLIESVFRQMSSEGVDLNNPRMISLYMAKLEEEDPEKFQTFKMLMESLMDDEVEEAPEGTDYNEVPEGTEQAPAEQGTELQSPDFSQMPSQLGQEEPLQ